LLTEFFPPIESARQENITASQIIRNASVGFITKRGPDRRLDVPPHGVRVKIRENHDAVVVLKRHEKRDALVAT
jgi:hypothetical protein